MNTFFVVAAVLAVVCVVIYLFERRQTSKLKAYASEAILQSGLSDETKLDYLTNTSNQVKTVDVDNLSPVVDQRGEEEYQQVADSQTEKVEDKTNEVPSTHLQDVDPQEVPVKLRPQLTEEEIEKRLSEIFYFHSKEIVNGHRYTAAGTFIKVDPSEDIPSGRALLVAFAITSDEDTFSRKVGREVASQKLQTVGSRYVARVPVGADLQEPAALFNYLVTNTVPLTVFNAETIHELRHKMYDVNGYTGEEEDIKKEIVTRKQLKNNQILITVDYHNLGSCEACGETLVYLIPLTSFVPCAEEKLFPKKEESSVDESTLDPTYTEDHDQAVS